eukprot:scpid35408/ scgid3462/ 
MMADSRDSMAAHQRQGNQIQADNNQIINPWETQAFRQCYMPLIKKMTPDAMRTHCYSEDLISEFHRTRLKAITCPTDHNEELLSYLSRGSEASFIKFMEVIKEAEPYSNFKDVLKKMGNILLRDKELVNANGVAVTEAYNDKLSWQLREVERAAERCKIVFPHELSENQTARISTNLNECKHSIQKAENAIKTLNDAVPFQHNNLHVLELDIDQQLKILHEHKTQLALLTEKYNSFLIKAPYASALPSLDGMTSKQNEGTTAGPNDGSRYSCVDRINIYVKE